MIPDFNVLVDNSYVPSVMVENVQLPHCTASYDRPDAESKNLHIQLRKLVFFFNCCTMAFSNCALVS